MRLLYFIKQLYNINMIYIINIYIIFDNIFKSR